MQNNVYLSELDLELVVGGAADWTDGWLKKWGHFFKADVMSSVAQHLHRIGESKANELVKRLKSPNKCLALTLFFGPIGGNSYSERSTARVASSATLFGTGVVSMAAAGILQGTKTDTIDFTVTLPGGEEANIPISIPAVITGLVGLTTCFACDIQHLNSALTVRNHVRDANMKKLTECK